MSEFEDPFLRDPAHKLTVDDVYALTGAATPHFAMQLHNRLRRLTAALPEDDAVRLAAESELRRLKRLALDGERGTGESDLTPLRERGG